MGIKEEMLKHFLNKSIYKELIGYKLKDETLIPVIQRLIEIEANKPYNYLLGGVTVGTGVKFIPRYCPEIIKILEHTRVLDFLYEPVYIISF